MTTRNRDMRCLNGNEGWLNRSSPVFSARLATMASVSVLLLSLAACGGGGGGSNEDNPVTDDSNDTPAPVVDDNNPPELELIGEQTIVLKVGETFEEPGVVAMDEEDGDISSTVMITGTVDNSTAGLYSLSYEVLDAAGNASDTLVREVLVLERANGVVDTEVIPKLTEIEDPRGEMRPVGSTSYDDIQTDFIQGELLVASDDYAAVGSLAARWGGEIVNSMEFEDTDDIHVVKIDASGADTSVLDEHLSELGAEGYGDILFSSADALATYAVAIQESAETGMAISLNILTEPLGIGDGIVTEEATASTIDPEYDPNPFNWPYFNLGSPQDTGIGAAWQLLSVLDIERRSQIMVIDSGFIDIGDYPERTSVAGASFGSRNTTSCGGSPCPWHGTAVSHIAGAIPDNNLGIAGAAGNHAYLQLLQLGNFTLEGLVNLFRLSLTLPIDGPPAAINISGGIEIPPVLNILLNQLLDPVIDAGHRFGLVVVAAAGNSNIDVDKKARWFGRDMPWERSTMIPCETSSVICVGGLDYDSISKAADSNYGTDAEDDSVDIYTSYYTWIPSIQDNGSVDYVNKLGQGTSYSAPLVSGVIAMMRSANPNMSAEGIVSCLLRTAHEHGVTNASGGNQRRLNAFGALNCAETIVEYPLLAIRSPLSTTTTIQGGEGIDLLADSLGANGNRLPIEWISDLDGRISVPVENYTLLSVGTHNMTVSVTDEDGSVASESLTINVLNNLPSVEILNPIDDAQFREGQTISLRALSDDIDAGGQLDDAQIAWQVPGTGFNAAGHSASIPAGTLGIGSYSLVVVADDGTDTAEDRINFSIGECAGECPTVNITSPGDTVIRTSTRDDTGVYADVAFTILATDVEDGDISDDVVVESYHVVNNVNATLCRPLDFGIAPVTCDSFSSRLYLLPDADETQYLITASVVDSDGNEVEQTISVTLVYDLL